MFNYFQSQKSSAKVNVILLRSKKLPYFQTKCFKMKYILFLTMFFEWYLPQHYFTNVAIINDFIKDFVIFSQRLQSSKNVCVLLKCSQSMHLSTHMASFITYFTETHFHITGHHISLCLNNFLEA